MTWAILLLEAILLALGAAWYFGWERPRHRRRMFKDWQSGAVVLTEVERLHRENNEMRTLLEEWRAWRRGERSLTTDGPIEATEEFLSDASLR